MLAELKMKLEPDKPDFGYYQSSNLQGVLMEQLDSSYAELLHRQGLKPYSQYLLQDRQQVREWVVKTFTQEAYQQVMLPLMDGGFKEFTIEKKQIHVRICGKELHTLPKRELMQEFYDGTDERRFHMEFLSPTAFKSNAKYVMIPEIRYILQSLMNKYSAASDDMEMYDNETLEQLVDKIGITRYQLRSTMFPLEAVRIPAFRGEMTIHVGGTDTMARYTRLLLRFGEYSGVGIKTAMGMGGLRIKEGRHNDGERE